MSKNKTVILVESPSKAQKIQKFLDSKYIVLASMGHVFDLPAKGLNVDIKKNFKPNYKIMDGKDDLWKKILEAVANCDMLLLAGDPDREGEGLSFNILQEIRKIYPTIKYKRIKYNSITKQAIIDAISNAKDIDYDLVDSYETRRILDRLVGYKCSFITTSATGGKSAGRVQSAALRVLAEREKEIQSFIPKEYWDITADFIVDKNQAITSHIVTPDKMDIKSKSDADAVVAAINNQKFKVTKYESKQVSVSPRAPFTTSTLQQTAASLFGWDQDRTMRIAQKLYEDGNITYMRTDSVTIIPQVVNNIRSYIQNNHKAEYLPKTANIYANKAAAQAAHEAIRPVDINNQQITADAEGRKLYDLIWRRTVASQMSDAKNHSVSVRFAFDKYEFGASGSVAIFDGWKNIYVWSVGDDKVLPKLSVGDSCTINNILPEQKFTQPPSRYTKSSITKMYEETGIGRPSTYASITKTLKARNYIEAVANSYKVTDLGIKVCDFLVKSNFCFMDLNFTSDMEDKLDKIGEKELQKLFVLQEFWKRLKSDIDNATKLKHDASQTDIDCPSCKNKLLSKHGRFGNFYACSNKECKFTANIGADGKPLEKVKKEKVYGNESCPLCSSKMILRNSKLGEFFGCEKYPKCFGMRDKNGNLIEKKPKTPFKKKFFKKKENQ